MGSIYLHPAKGSPKGCTMHDDREHVISVVLNHEEWKEFVRVQPQPVNWLRERIQETIAASRSQTTTVSTPARMA